MDPDTLYNISKNILCQIDSPTCALTVFGQQNCCMGQIAGLSYLNHSEFSVVSDKHFFFLVKYTVMNTIKRKKTEQISQRNK